MADDILVTGATGMLGRYVMRLLEESGRDRVHAPGRDECDLLEPRAVYDLVKRIRPAFILHLAAETDVDLCEREPGRAGLINHLATEAIARAAGEVGSWLLYVSTSNVFGGEAKLVYNELDIPSPMNYYGRSKLHGELAIRGRLPDDHLIVRAGWMIGGGVPHDHKFVGKIVKQIREKTEILRAVTDKFGSLTSASLLANFIVASMNDRLSGTVHFCSAGIVTRLDVARAIAEILSYEGEIVGVPSSMFPLPAPRPQSEGIESVYMSSLARVPNSWRRDLADYLREFDI